MMHLPPNMFVFGAADVVRLLVIWPTGPETSQFLNYLIFPEEWHSDPDFRSKVKDYVDYNVSIVNEDYVMIKSLQAAMSSVNFEPGRLSILERPIHHMLNTLLTRTLG